MDDYINPYDPPLASPHDDEPAFRRMGVVSIWAGSIGTVEAAEGYFGVLQPNARYSAPYTFSEEFEPQPFSLECLEINFTQAAPRRLRQLLETASFSSSYVEAACAAGGILSV